MVLAQLHASAEKLMPCSFLYSLALRSWDHVGGRVSLTGRAIPLIVRDRPRRWMWSSRRNRPAVRLSRFFNDGEAAPAPALSYVRPAEGGNEVVDLTGIEPVTS